MSAPTLADRPRCWWTGGDGRPDGLLAAYHDEEWGVPVHDDVALFERLALESFQAGLSWATILRKRDGFRSAFAGFVPALVARFDAADRERLLAEPAIVRNRAKIDATIGNAAVVLDLAREFGSFDVYLAATIPPRGPLPPGTRPDDLVPRTPVSDALSADLRRRGMRFVGSTIVYAFMESVGLVDDHLPGCFRYAGAD